MRLVREREIERERERERERSEECLMGGPERPAEKTDVSEAELGTEVDVEDEDVYVVGCVTVAGVSGYESQGFTLSKIP